MGQFAAQSEEASAGLRRDSEHGREYVHGHSRSTTRPDGQAILPTCPPSRRDRVPIEEYRHHHRVAGVRAANLALVIGATAGDLEAVCPAP